MPADDRAARYGPAKIEANSVERVLADINAHYGDRGTRCLRHGVLLLFGAPWQLTAARQEHGRTIPLAALHTHGVKILSHSDRYCLSRSAFMSFQSTLITLIETELRHDVRNGALETRPAGDERLAAADDLLTLL